MATWVLTDETCNINFAQNGVSHRTLPKELTVLEVVLAGEPLNDTTVDCVFVRYEGKYAIELPYNDTTIGITGYASAELLRAAILALLNNNPCVGMGGGGVDEFSELTDAYDLATAPAFSVPINSSGTLIPANIYDSTPIIVDAGTTAALAGTWNYANGVAGVGATLTRTTNGAFESQDGVSAAVNRKYLIKNWTGANRVRNGVYTLTTVGTAGTAAVLTRATDSDTLAELDGQIVLVSAGTTLRGTSWRQTSSAPVVGTTIIVYQTNAVAAPSVTPTSITVAAAQALVTAGTVVVGRYYSITDSTQVWNAEDRIVTKGATPNDFDVDAMYIDSVNGASNPIKYIIDDTPLDLIIYREDSSGNAIWDAYKQASNYGTLLSFPFYGTNVFSNTCLLGFVGLSWPNTNYLDNNVFLGENTLTDGGFNVNVFVRYNIAMYGSSIIVASDNITIYGNIIGRLSSVTSSSQITDCIIGANCAIDDGGFNIRGCTFLSGTTYTAIANVDNAIIGPLGIIDTTKVIDTTAGDSATIDSMTGRFRKDVTGATFTLTNSYIVPNSIIQLTPANAAIDATATHWTVSAGLGSAVITFNAAPTANFDLNFTVTN